MRAFEVRIQSGKQVVTVVVDQEPRFVGVDPYNKRIDRNAEDKLVRVRAVHRGWRSSAGGRAVSSPVIGQPA